MANVPPPEQDGWQYADDLPRNESEIFLRKGLDHPNQIERVQQIQLLVRGVIGFPFSNYPISFPRKFAPGFVRQSRYCFDGNLSGAFHGMEKTWTGLP
jgi:hypothetical protein